MSLLSALDISTLSRLMDEALDLPLDARQAWLDALPLEHRGLVGPLQQMIFRSVTDDGAAVSSLPRLPELAADDAGEPQANDRVGPYRLLSEIGRGGMGAVWLAERADGIFEREVAVKLPRLSRGPNLAERMARERNIGARLEHPHIARLYDAGIDEAGRPYLVMERIVGVDLATYCDQAGLDSRQRVDLFLQVCEAVAHAHRQLVVHRDLKPTNILVTEDGQVKLLDFGIAELLSPEDVEQGSGSDRSERRTHTPAYAAPEQVAGAPITTASDIYSLGVILCELLSGGEPTAPFDESTRPVSVSADLWSIVGRATRPDPIDRYSSVERLADDLGRALTFRPVLAARATIGHRVALFARRHGSALGAGAMLTLGLAATGVTLQRQQAQEEAEAQRAHQSREFLFDLLEDAEPVVGQTPADITGAQMVESALARARSSFAGQPALKGQVLTELGIMLRRVQKPDAALEVLGEANALLESSVPESDPALQVARAQLALELRQHGDKEMAGRAAGLAERALANCASASTACAKARAYADDVLMSLANQRGDRTEALTHARHAVTDSELAFGSDNTEVAHALIGLAIISRNAGELVAADAALERSSRIARATPLRAADASDLDAYRTLVHFDLGRYPDALAEIAAQLQAPATDKRRALLHRLNAQIYLAQGLPGRSHDEAQEAVASATKADSDWELVFATQSRARAAGALRHGADAERDIEATLATLRAMKMPETGVELLRARRIAGELALEAGDLKASQALLERLPIDHQPGGAGSTVTSPTDLAQAFDLLGTLARMRGEPERSLSWHEQASRLYSERLPPEHPLRLRNAVLRASAAWLRSTPGADSRPRTALEQEIARYLESLPAESTWRKSLASSPDDRIAWQNLIL